MLLISNLINPLKKDKSSSKIKTKTNPCLDKIKNQKSKKIMPSARRRMYGGGEGLQPGPYARGPNDAGNGQQNFQNYAGEQQQQQQQQQYQVS